jgi:hypothetical protein
MAIIRVRILWAACVHATCVAVIMPVAANSAGVAPKSRAIAEHSVSSKLSSSAAVVAKLVVASKNARSLRAASAVPKSPPQFGLTGRPAPQLLRAVAMAAVVRARRVEFIFCGVFIEGLVAFNTTFGRAWIFQKQPNSHRFLAHVHAIYSVILRLNAQSLQC